MFGVQPSLAGIPVSEDTAMRFLAVHACVKVLAESLAVTPLILYERLPNGGKKRATDNSLYPILHDLPNPYCSSFEFREQMQGTVALRGNSYAKVIRNGGGRVLSLEPLIKSQVKVYRLESGRVAYDICDTPGSKPYTLLGGEGEILHIKGFSKDGLTGLSPIGEAREAVGLGLAAERYGAQFFKNDARPGGVLEHPGTFKKAETAQRISDEWQSIYAGDGRHKIAVLQEGMTFKPLGLSNEDSQYIETRRFQKEEICGLFRVPPHLIGDLSHATFSNIEHQGLEFLTYTMLSWFKRWEQAIHRDILTPRERETYFVEFLVEGFLRGDFASRQAGLAIQRQNGIINADEWRHIDNMNPIGGEQGTKYWAPLNMGQGGAANPAAPQVKEQQP